MHVTSIQELQDHLPEILHKVANGEEVVIGDGERPMAKMVPFSPQPGGRRPLGILAPVYEAPGIWDPDPEDAKLFNDGPIFPEEA